MKSFLTTIIGVYNYSIVVVLSGYLLAIIILTRLSFDAVSSPYSKKQIHQRPLRREPKVANSWHRQVQHKGCLYFILGMMLVVASFALVLILDGISR